MAGKKQNAVCKYRVRNVFPGKAFTKPDQQRMAARISNQLTLRKAPVLKSET